MHEITVIVYEMARPDSLGNSAVVNRRRPDRVSLSLALTYSGLRNVPHFAPITSHVRRCPVLERLQGGR